MTFDGAEPQSRAALRMLSPSQRPLLHVEAILGSRYILVDARETYSYATLLSSETSQGTSMTCMAPENEDSLL